MFHMWKSTLHFIATKLTFRITLLVAHKKQVSCLDLIEIVTLRIFEKHAHEQISNKWKTVNIECAGFYRVSFQLFHTLS